MPMLLRVSALALALSAAAAAGAAAADLSMDGSMKDGPAAHRAGGPCYFRSDAAYSWNEDAEGIYGEYADGELILENMEDGWALEAGLGCGSARGLRGEVVLGWRSDREFEGYSADEDEELRANLSSWTAMFNAYYDVGQWGAFVPYVGAGIGFAMNDISDVSSVDGTETMPDASGSGTDLAWSLMAGTGYKVDPAVTLDMGYRFTNLGAVGSGESAEEPIEIDDISFHEVKAGIRYSFGSLF